MSLELRVQLKMRVCLFGVCISNFSYNVWRIRIRFNLKIHYSKISEAIHSKISYIEGSNVGMAWRDLTFNRSAPEIRKSTGLFLES